MDIGPEKPPYIAEPLRDPFHRPEPAPAAPVEPAQPAPAEPVPA